MAYWLFDSPFYTGGAQAATDIGPNTGWDVALAGHRYQIDWDAQSSFSRQFRHESIPLMRTQSDASSKPTEASLNPEDLWRRGQDDWSAGAGQTYFDKSTSIDSRYADSLGIDPWTQGQFSLLPDVAQQRTITPATYLAVAGSALYALSGSVVQYATDLDTPTWTVVTNAGTAVSGINSAATDGYRVWFADNTDLYYTTRTGATYNQWHGTRTITGSITASVLTVTSGTLTSADSGKIITGTGINPGTTISFTDSTHAAVTGTTSASSTTITVGILWPATLVRYAKGRLFTANGTSLYNNAAQGTPAPSALLTHPNPDWAWTDIAEGPDAVYFSGYSGDKSLVYKTAIKSDGTTLDVPSVAGELPDGEIVRTMQGYLGFLLLGTDKGVRFATLDASGNIQAIGDLIPTGQCLCLEPQDRFVWFGWNNYDATHTGLGRVDLRTLNGTTPAYASDLMAPTSGACVAVVTCQGRRVFSILGHGVYWEIDDRVTSGTLRVGPFNYGLPDPKTAVSLIMRNANGGGTYQAEIGADGASFVSAGGIINAADAGGAKVSAGPRRSTGFDLRFTLSRDGTDLATGPIVNRWTLRVVPSGPSSKLIHVPILLHTHQTIGVSDRYVSVADEQAFLEDLRATQEIVTYQEGDTSYSVTVEDFYFMPYHKAPIDGAGAPWDATMYLQLKTVV